MASVRSACESAPIVARGNTEISEDAEAGGAKARTAFEIPEAHALIESGRQAGSLSSEEIALALDDLGLDAALLDDFYSTLDDLQIEVVSAADQDDASPTGGESEREVSTDSLQLFLKDIGKVELLSAAQEIELAKRIERGEHRAKQEMVEANLRLVVSI